MGTLIAARVQEGRYYYHANDLYSVAALTNASGVVVERYKFDPYGKVTVLDASGTAKSDPNNSEYGNPFTYTGQRLDKETRLMYYKNRYYSTALGRFVSRDPIKYRGSKWNLYEYVKGKAESWVDPKGYVLTVPWDDEHGFFKNLLNTLCPEGKWDIGYWDDKVYSTIPDFCEDREVWVPIKRDESIPECYRGPEWYASGYLSFIPRGCKNTKHPFSCCCICDAINRWTNFELHKRKEEGGLTDDFGSIPGVIDVQINVGPGRKGGYPGFGDPTMPAGRVQSQSAIILGHELCGHGLLGVGHPPEGDPKRYSVTDPSVEAENKVRAEHGWGTRTGEK
ncbi:MAG: RHS repeat-associated core domain-containing protein [Planctomycetes bacterium]|nr:RHS repeat-associated core domain-containing protein [Planctomycetota bacterium]